jgi:thiosulfate/3-mercaptopyruvate sulfurtransferase
MAKRTVKNESAPQKGAVVQWVSPDWAAERCTRGELLILDTQPNVHDYFIQHIPGAVYFNEGLLRVPYQGLPAKYADTLAIELALRRVGVRRDLPVLVYSARGEFKGWGDGLEQTMLAYALVRYGHAHVHLLDGGLEAYTQAGHTVEQKFPQITHSDFKADIQGEYFVEYDEFKQMKDRADVVLLDARPFELYAGSGPWQKPGHIPGAVSLPWKSFTKSDNPRALESPEEIRRLLDEHNITPDRTIVCSCGTGREATIEFLLFKWHLKFPNVRIYEGSFTEWTAHPENETVTGANPR